MHRFIALIPMLSIFLLTACGAAPQNPAPVGPVITALPTMTAVPTATAMPTPLPTATPAPPEPTALPPTDTPAPTATSMPTETPPPAPPPPVAMFGSEVLFLRNGALIAFDTAKRTERTLADGVREFAATPDGLDIALVRGDGPATELWRVARDGSGLTQLTRNRRVEAHPSWAPDGRGLVYASAESDANLPIEWNAWTRWCAASDVRLLSIGDPNETTLAQGCDPVFSPDGRRIAYAARPAAAQSGFADPVPLMNNSIRLINRRGQNGWDLAVAAGAEIGTPNAGSVVYAPAWSPDGTRIVYQRYLGYMALSDLSLLEITSSFENKGQPLALGFGWVGAVAFAPNARSLAFINYDPGDARGWGGYDLWSAGVLQLDGSRTIYLPTGELTAIGQDLGDPLRPRIQAAAWAPDSTALVFLTPPGWSSGMQNEEPFDPQGRTPPGEIWRVAPNGTAPEQLAAGVDPASPLLWLPPTPRVQARRGTSAYQLVYPDGWQVAAPSEFEEQSASAPDGIGLISVAPLTGVTREFAQQDAAQLFGMFVGSVTRSADPITWPDGSVYREFEGFTPQGAAIAGATRVLVRPDGTAMVVLYRTSPERWALERPFAQGLLMRCG